MREIIANLNYWKLAFARAALYALMTGSGFFMTSTETWSQDTWNSTGWFLKVRLFIGVGMTIAGAILAFLDNTMQGLRNGRNEKDLTLPPV